MATIKAGTYRFHDEIIAKDGDHIDQEINFYFNIDASTVVEGLDAIVKFNCSKISVWWEDYNLDFNYICYVIDETEPSSLVVGGQSYNVADFLHITLHEEFVVYKNGWGNSLPPAITIPTDTDVSDEFGTWFAENAKPCISGVWKLNDSLVFSQGNIEESVNFSVNLTYEGTKCVAFVDTIHVDADIEEVSGHSYRVEPESTTLEEGIGFGYFNGSWDWETWGDVVNVFDFGTEPQPVSAEFYAWITANAVQPVATVTYNGAVIANLFDGQTATLKCKGKKMESDIVVVLA